MNTELIYLYRDSCNYKKYYEVIIEGVLNYFDIENYLWEKEFFIPSEVNLPDLQDFPLKEYDHIWHEIDSISPSNKPATLPMSSDQLIKYFKQAKKQNWNEYAVFKRFELL